MPSRPQPLVAHPLRPHRDEAKLCAVHVVAAASLSGKPSIFAAYQPHSPTNAVAAGAPFLPSIQPFGSFCILASTPVLRQCASAARLTTIWPQNGNNTSDVSPVQIYHDEQSEDARLRRECN